MKDVPSGDQLPTQSDIDQRTGLKPPELDHLRSLTGDQRAAIVVELGGVWPNKPEGETATETADTSEVGDIALDGVVTTDEVAPNAVLDEDELSPEKRAAIEAISSNPAVSVGIDYWDYGSAWHDISAYKFKRISDETRDSERLREDFNSILLLNHQEVRELLEDRPTGYWARVCKFENEDGVTYKLFMKSPKTVRDRPTIDMIVSIPMGGGLRKEVEQLDSDPAMFLELYKAFAKGQTAHHRESNGPTKLADLVEGVETPLALSEEEVRKAIEIINDKKTRLNINPYRDYIQPLHPESKATESYVPTVGNLPAESRRSIFGRKRH